MKIRDEFPAAWRPEQRATQPAGGQLSCDRSPAVNCRISTASMLVITPSAFTSAFRMFGSELVSPATNCSTSVASTLVMFWSRLTSPQRF